MEACTGDRGMAATSLSPHSTSFPSSWWLVWAPEAQKEGRKNLGIRVVLLYYYCCALTLGFLYTAEARLLAFSPVSTLISLGDSLLDLLSKVLLGQASPLPAGYRVVHPSVESHHHFR